MERATHTFSKRPANLAYVYSVKVFDASGIMGILPRIGRPEIIDMLVDLGHRAAVQLAIVENSSQISSARES